MKLQSLVPFCNFTSLLTHNILIQTSIPLYHGSPAALVTIPERIEGMYFCLLIFHFEETAILKRFVKFEIMLPFYHVLLMGNYFNETSNSAVPFNSFLFLIFFVFVLMITKYDDYLYVNIF